MILDNFPKVLWINLDRSVERRKHMQKLLDSYQLDHFRIRAVDGVGDDDPELENICEKNLLLTRRENACTCSHLKALKYFIEKTSEKRIIIFEDDISFEFLPLISSDWREFEKRLPNDYDVIQLSIYSHIPVSNKLTRRNAIYKHFYFSAGAYLVTREAAQEILDGFYSSEIHKFDLSSFLVPVADKIVYSLSNTYSIPIFTYLTNDSSMHAQSLNTHYKSKLQQYEVWQRNKNIIYDDDNIIFIAVIVLMVFYLLLYQIPDHNILFDVIILIAILILVEAIPYENILH